MPAAASSRPSASGKPVTRPRMVASRGAVKAAARGRKGPRSAAGRAGPRGSVGKLCKRAPITIDVSTTVADAARLMRDQHVGALVAVDAKRGGKPVGILTDRDLVVGVIALDLDCDLFTVGDVMSPAMTTLNSTDGVDDAIALMRRQGIRRIPVIAPSGALAGVVALDDLLEYLSAELAGVVAAIKREQQRETRTRKHVG